MIGEALALVGALFVLVAAFGSLRFRDTLSRMHAVSKAATLGVVLVLIGAALKMPDANDWTTLTLAMVLQLVTSPVSANLISRSVYLTAGSDPRA